MAHLLPIENLIGIVTDLAQIVLVPFGRLAAAVLWPHQRRNVIAHRRFNVGQREQRTDCQICMIKKIKIKCNDRKSSAAKYALTRIRRMLSAAKVARSVSAMPERRRRRRRVIAVLLLLLKVERILWMRSISSGTQQTNSRTASTTRTTATGRRAPAGPTARIGPGSIGASSCSGRRI